MKCVSLIPTYGCVLFLPVLSALGNAVGGILGILKIDGFFQVFEVNIGLCYYSCRFVSYVVSAVALFSLCALAIYRYIYRCFRAYRSLALHLL